MDFTAVSAVLGNIKTATEIAKLIKDSGATLDKAETKLKLAEPIEALADAKLDVVSLQEKLSSADLIRHEAQPWPLNGPPWLPKAIGNACLIVVSRVAPS